jgi:endonuclease/exonuclease/phosphatase family metal-dependent hydrolase
MINVQLPSKKFCALLLMLCFFSSPAFAQDTLRLMTYNVLNYTSTDANANRYLSLRTIVAYYQPDMMICSEMIDGSGAQRLLDSAFNVNGINYYSRAAFPNGPDTDNMLYYNNQKVKLKSQNQISTNLRDITRYRVYHVISPGDTAYLNLFSAHLKAGSLPADATTRLGEVTDFCNYITLLPQSENLIIGGDFNVYSNTEQAWTYITSTSCPHVFYDPINAGGAWNSNSLFAGIHTQSTRSSSNPGCCGGATGGLDDRFDFLLANNRVMNGGSKIRYIPGSYKACGNDGNHLNKSIIEAPVNSSVPSNVNTALFNMSDHLPVLMELEVGNTVGIHEFSKDEFSFQLMPESSGSFSWGIYSPRSIKLDLKIYDVRGAMVMDKKIELNVGNNRIFEVDQKFFPGCYIAKIHDENNLVISSLIIIN